MKGKFTVLKGFNYLFVIIGFLLILSAAFSYGVALWAPSSFQSTIQGVPIFGSLYTFFVQTLPSSFGDVIDKAKDHQTFYKWSFGISTVLVAIPTLLFIYSKLNKKNKE
ncbi:hypothetical protein [Malacoplasma iowae]|uniref:hypothetical protein n=1 Tax=Malacoplasma iowae TaxID=2116 RepID=UPI002A18B6CE|nr:hypothetical protein [Malacoplasma iowae]WPL40243.1 hypothetical protein QX183_01665 [Malacoplasma iowae]